MRQPEITPDEYFLEPVVMPAYYIAHILLEAGGTLIVPSSK